MRARWFWVTLTVGVAMAGPVRADVVGPPEENCPPGSVGATSHSGPYCAVDACSTEPGNDACDTGLTCADQRLCIEQIPCGGMEAPDSAPCTLTSVTATCFSNNSCVEGTCQSLRVCVPSSGTGGKTASDDRDLSQDSGCGCRAGGSAEGSWVGAWVVAGWIGVRRRGGWKRRTRRE